MSRRRLTVIGFLGSTLDQGKRGPARWERWRPTVALCQHEDLLVDRLELLFEPKFTSLCQVICQDVAGVSPETQVRTHAVPFDDPWDFEAVYGALHDFARGYPFNPDAED